MSEAVVVKQGSTFGWAFTHTNVPAGNWSIACEIRDEKGTLKATAETQYVERGDAPGTWDGRIEFASDMLMAQRLLPKQRIALVMGIRFFTDEYPPVVDMTETIDLVIEGSVTRG